MDERSGSARPGLGGEPDQLFSGVFWGGHALGERNPPGFPFENDVAAFRVDAGHAPGSGGAPARNVA